MNQRTLTPYEINHLQKHGFSKPLDSIGEQPVEYVTGHAEFCGLDFLVNPSVLIPRLESEKIVHFAVDYINRQNLAHPAVADIGTGSGCIAITLAKFLPKAKIYATDICKKALGAASKNAKIYNVKINFIQGNLLEPLKNKKIDIVVANLPYGWKEWKNNSSTETSGLKFEPQKALFTKEGGLFLYLQLFSQLAKRKQKPKSIYGEFDPRQKKDLQKIIKKYLPEYKVKIKKDLAGRDRIFIANI